MEVINSRSALLSNFEVLELLRDLENDHLARTKTAIRVKKEEEASGIPSQAKHPATIEVTENVRTIQVEAIQYLTAEYQLTSSQTSNGITQLVKDLANYKLTKAEKLQIVNLAPTQPVELYVIVEELEDRLGEAMETVLSTVSASLSAAPSHPLNASSPAPVLPMASSDTMADLSLQYPSEDFNDAGMVNDMVFDDEGQGVGIEGDLDKEEED
ncbi:RNA polymerase Rpb4-domain-containing protein [Lentinula boryana]|uniref:DNA-directed RNA polymerase III subunit RPC9 n=1 Tax=Lentinula boryana TaxID=40481 RepID=A0ABQ8Q9I9_9AGAR|nr:RNA polymerase Rpb4-domain-containing protein [Lentinula boryana]